MVPVCVFSFYFPSPAERLVWGWFDGVFGYSLSPVSFLKPNSAELKHNFIKLRILLEKVDGFPMFSLGLFYGTSLPVLIPAQK